MQVLDLVIPHVRGGQFIGPDGFGEFRGHPTVVQPDGAAQDQDVAHRPWTVSEQRTRIACPVR
ncbi:hypothetical protein ACIBCA_02610 [Kitasatospora sp. NPDC051170]|uniref:hypothetical protein n=1 Tax=Kitasatospora sp. NPDC051170 TaxID=3364056 RepID=UPI00378D6342